MKRAAQITLIGLLSLAFVSPALARGRHHQHRGKRFAKMLQKLGIDDATKSQIKNVFIQSRAAARAIRSQLRTQRRTFRQMLLQDSPNQAALMSAIDSMGALKIKLKKLRIKTILNVRQLLTPQQRQQMMQMVKQRRAKWRARWKAKRGRFFKHHSRPALTQ